MSAYVCVECGATYPSLPNDLGDCPRCRHAGALAGALEAGTTHTLGPSGPEVKVTRDLDAHAAAALHRLARWVVSLDEPLTATDREIANELGDGSQAWAARVRRWRQATGIPARRGRPRTEGATRGGAEWVVSLPQRLAEQLQAVGRAEVGARLRAHLSERGTRAGACAVGRRAVEREALAWAHWAGAAQDRLESSKPAPASPGDEPAVKLGLGRWSEDERAELARRAEWAGLRTAVYAAEVVLLRQH